LNIEIAPTASVWAKVDAVAGRLREERVLLLLDGVEPLQDASGAMNDKPLQALLQELDTENRGLVICTTRVRIDIPDDPPRVLSLDLDNLTPEQGAEYLRSLKVQGEDEELRQASQEYWNHALALTLLGTYLVDFCAADVCRRIEIAKLTVEEVRQGKHASHVIAAYDVMFAGKPEAAILRALGYFNRPAEPEALKLVLPGMEDLKYRAALIRLHAARLILTTDPTQPLDCHPLVREHFAAEATAEGHARLYDHYKNQAPQLPDTLEGMTPLFYAVYHGCRAGQHQAAFRDVYRYRILRGGDFYLHRRLGAFGTGLSLLANFFLEAPWGRLVATLSQADQSWILNEAGFILRALGRLADAIGPTRVGAEASVKAEDWLRAADVYNNISEIHLTLGDIPEAVAAARQAVDFANRSGDAYWKVNSRTTLADALHQSGEVREAKRLFEEAERLQAEPVPAILYVFRGYRYCDLLLGQGQIADVLGRASQTLPWSKRRGRLLGIGLDHLLLGRAHPSGSAEAAHHLDQAVDHIRRSGHLDQLPRALLARGKPHDLDEVFRIATRSGMRLYLADYHLAMARREHSCEHFEKAERLIAETGYHRRDAELEQLRADLAL
jgi:tetratricopeptide (TPR) repeat protein